MFWEASESVSLDIHCPRCGGGLTVECVDWRDNEPDDAPPVPTVDLPCPFCRQLSSARIPAVVLWVAERPAKGSAGVH
jgi:hypothetical protein